MYRFTKWYRRLLLGGGALLIGLGLYRNGKKAGYDEGYEDGEAAAKDEARNQYVEMLERNNELLEESIRAIRRP